MPYKKTNEPGIDFEFFQGTITQTGTAVCIGKKANLWTVLAENSDASAICYLQFFDAAALSDVTVGTTAPVFTMACHPSSTIQIDRGNFPIKWFATGIVVAATAGRTGSTAPTTAPVVMIHF